MSIRRTHSFASHSFHLKGISAAPGIAQGMAYVLNHSPLEIPHYWISNQEVLAEAERFQSALRKTKEQFEKIKERLCRYEGKEQIHILDSYTLILQDEMLVSNTLNTIKTLKINAEWSLEKTLQKIKKVFVNVDEEYFRERKKDVDFVGERIFKNLAGDSEEPLSKIPPHSLVIAHDLSPADTAQLLKFKIGGFVTEVGGKTSHTAIIARALRVPAIVACPEATQKIRTSDHLILNGDAGILQVHPTPKEIAAYEIQQRSKLAEQKKLLQERRLSATTQDGVQIHLLANLELLEEVPLLREYATEGVGLYRTEFLYLNNPEQFTEEKQLEVYKKILQSFSPQEVTIRVLDLGADKIASDSSPEKNLNSALGLRGIRLLLKHKDLLKTQLRALLRASVSGKLKILVPMVMSVQEIKKFKSILGEVERELRKKKIPFKKAPLGVMIEIPAAVLIANALADEVDFFSVGTNDLIQYTLALDRGNEQIAHLYNPLHPALLQLLERVAKTSQEKGIPTTVCGEMASDPIYIQVLVGLGFCSLSMNAVSILQAKRKIRSTRFQQLQAIAQKLLTAPKEEDLQRWIRKLEAK